MEKAIVSGPGAVSPHRGTLGDILTEVAALERDWAIVSQVLAVWASINTLAVGASQTVPELHVDMGSKRFDWSGGTITRTS